MNVGFDIDGTLTRERFEDIHAKVGDDQAALNEYIKKMLDFTPTIYVSILRDFIQSNDKVFVISYRWESWAEITWQWFKRYGIQKEDARWFFTPPELRTSSPEIYRERAVKYKSDDTQYTTEEYASNKMIVQGFGHSTYDMAGDNANQANAKRLVCMHYNPSHTDADLDKIQKKNVDIVLAREGMIIEV